MTRVHELRPCDACGGPIGTVFNVVRVSPAFVDLGAVDWRETWLCMECSNLRDVSLAMALEKADRYTVERRAAS